MELPDDVDLSNQPWVCIGCLPPARSAPQTPQSEPTDAHVVSDSPASPPACILLESSPEKDEAEKDEQQQEEEQQQDEDEDDLPAPAPAAEHDEATSTADNTEDQDTPNVRRSARLRNSTRHAPAPSPSPPTPARTKAPIFMSKDERKQLKVTKAQKKAQKVVENRQQVSDEERKKKNGGEQTLIDIRRLSLCAHDVLTVSCDASSDIPNKQALRKQQEEGREWQRRLFGNTPSDSAAPCLNESLMRYSLSAQSCRPQAAADPAPLPDRTNVHVFAPEEPRATAPLAWPRRALPGSPALASLDAMGFALSRTHPSPTRPDAPIVVDDSSQDAPSPIVVPDDPTLPPNLETMFRTHYQARAASDTVS